MSWMDIAYICFEYLFGFVKAPKPKEKPVKSVVLKKRLHIDQAEFYERVTNLLIMATHTYDLSTSQKVKEACLDVTEICHHILQAEHVADQSHIRFNDFYYEKIHGIYGTVLKMHTAACNLDVKFRIKRSIMNDLY